MYRGEAGEVEAAGHASYVRSGGPAPLEIRPSAARVLRDHPGGVILREGLRRRARAGTLTLVYSAKDTEHNDAVVLAEVLRRGLPSGVGR